MCVYFIRSSECVEPGCWYSKLTCEAYLMPMLSEYRDPTNLFDQSQNLIIVNRKISLFYLPR